jgi:hypothetical protein
MLSRVTQKKGHFGIEVSQKFAEKILETDHQLSQNDNYRYLQLVELCSTFPTAYGSISFNNQSI